MSHYHQYNGVSPIANGHKYIQHSSQHHQPQSMQHMRPISSYYEYETINPNGNYRKLGEQFIPLQNSISSGKIVNGSSSVRITGNAMRGTIPDMSNIKGQQHRGPFITQVNLIVLYFIQPCNHFFLRCIYVIKMVNIILPHRKYNA